MSRCIYSFREKRMALLLAVLFCGSLCIAEETVRIATYNIKFLTRDISAARLANLKAAIRDLDADVIGLQEIADRAALEIVFPKTEWHIIIDDESNFTQDVAVVVRKPLRVPGFAVTDLDADDQHFLFPGSSNNILFPDRRDLLVVEVQPATVNSTFFVMVHHAKSRVGGRPQTDVRRADAAVALMRKLEQDYDGRDFVLLGDFNDSPDDRSLNILETGNPNAVAAMENDPDVFLMNLTEPLFADGHVTFGRNTSDLIGPDNQRFNTIDPDARTRNFVNRNEDVNTGDCLFDQLLIPLRMRNKYAMGSARVFDGAPAVLGNNNTRASDHIPVSADFTFGSEEPSTGSEVRIIALLPNPAGTDAGHETVTIRNGTATSLALAGWSLKDRSGNTHALTGTITAGADLVVTLPGTVMPLNNDGDEVMLMDQNGVERHRVTYAGNQVTSGAQVMFE